MSNRYSLVASQLRGESGQHMVVCAVGKGLLDFAEAQAKSERSGTKAKQPVVLPGLAVRACATTKPCGGDLILVLSARKEQIAPVAQKR